MICARKSCSASFEARRGGKPRRYCCAACRNAESQARHRARPGAAEAHRKHQETYRKSCKALDFAGA